MTTRDWLALHPEHKHVVLWGVDHRWKLSIESIIFGTRRAFSNLLMDLRIPTLEILKWRRKLKSVRIKYGVRRT